MARTLQQIAVITTGGTIAEGGNAGAGRTHAAGEDMLTRAGHAEGPQVTNLLDLPSTFIGLAEMLEIFKAIRSAFATGSEAVIVTHGTDTLEETAFFIDLLHDDHRPIVLTAAMLPNGAPGADGQRNLLDALAAARSSKMPGLGAVVVLEGEIHAARDVTKFHSTSLGAFKSPEFGPLGVIDEGRVTIARRPASRTVLQEPSHLPVIEAIKCYAGMTDIFPRAAIGAAADGLVIETLGSGQVPPNLMPAIKEAVSRGITVVAAPRSPTGRLIRDHYGQPQRVAGDERDLRDAGVVFADFPGQKTRIQLALALGAGLAGEDLRRTFEGAGDCL